MNHKTFRSDGGGSSIDWWHVLITVTAHFFAQKQQQGSHVFYLASILHLIPSVLKQQP